jgi:hypothetical protein
LSQSSLDCKELQIAAGVKLPGLMRVVAVRDDEAEEPPVLVVEDVA